MSTVDYKALAERVAQRAIYADNNADPNNKTWAADLRAVVSLLNGMPDAKPVAWRVECRWLDRSKGGDWRKYADYGTEQAARSSQQVFANPGDIESRIVPLYAHPAPQPQPGPTPEQEAALQRMADNARELGLDYEPMPQPERQPLTDEQIDEIGEPFGYFTYGDAQGDKRRAFVRAIESSHGIGYGKAIEGGPSELRSCTCHPDDNPPAPCAQQYALNECRAAQPERQPVSEPTEAQSTIAERRLRHALDGLDHGIVANDVREVLDELAVLRAALAAKEQPE